MANKIEVYAARVVPQTNKIVAVQVTTKGAKALSLNLNTFSKWIDNKKKLGKRIIFEWC